MEYTTKSFKILLVGDAGVGKTAFINRHLTGEFSSTHLPTNVHTIAWETTQGIVNFEICVTTSKCKSDHIEQNYHTGAHAAIIMFDVSNRLSYKSVPNWSKYIREVCGDIPIVLVGNKVDLETREVYPRQITIHQRLNIPYIETSTKSCYNYDEPFSSLLSTLTGNSNIPLVQTADE